MRRPLFAWPAGTEADWVRLDAIPAHEAAHPYDARHPLQESAYALMRRVETLEGSEGEAEAVLDAKTLPVSEVWLGIHGAQDITERIGWELVGCIQWRLFMRDQLPDEVAAEIRRLRADLAKPRD